MRVALLPLLLSVACSDTPLSPPPSAPEGLREVDEPTQYEEDQRFFQARRDAYEADGTIPTVPPSLSADPYDPTYTFDGYMRIADEAEHDAHTEEIFVGEVPESTVDEDEANARPLYEEDEVAILVNDVGETWRWSPTDLKDRLAARRRDRGHDDDTYSVDASDTRDDGAELDLLRSGILGADGRHMRSDWSGHSMTSHPWEAIGSLELNGRSTNDHPMPGCTATKIGRRTLFTAGHCVFEADQDIGSLKKKDWWPGADGITSRVDGSGGAPNGYKNVLWYVTSSKYVDKGWESRDYAVLVMYDNSSSCNLYHLGYRVDNSLVGMEPWSFGYPYWYKECPSSSPLSGNDCGGSMWGMSAQIDDTNIYYAWVDHDAQPGQSGAALYDYNGGNRQMVAHLKRELDNNNNDNLAIKMKNRIFDFIEGVKDDHPHSCN